MEYNELIADFAQRHNVADLVSVDGAASLDIDRIIVTIVLRSAIPAPDGKLFPVIFNLLRDHSMLYSR